MVILQKRRHVTLATLDYESHQSAVVIMLFSECNHNYEFL